MARNRPKKRRRNDQRTDPAASLPKDTGEADTDVVPSAVIQDAIELAETFARGHDGKTQKIELPGEDENTA